MKKIMRTIVVAGIALLLSMSTLAQQPGAAPKQSPPAGGPPKPFKVPPKQTFKLANGVDVTMVPYGVIPKVTVVVTVRAGSLNEAADQVWLSEINSRLIKDGGTTSRSAEQVAQEAAAMGSSINVGAGFDQTLFSSDVLSEFGPRLVALLADVIQHPKLPESELGRLKQDAVRRLAIAKSQSQPLASEQFMKALYPDHPYGRSFPTEEMVNKLTIADVQKFYKDNFGAARTHIYVAGKFDAQAMRKAITDSFSGWAHGPDPLVSVPKPVTKREVTLIDRPNAAQSTLYIGLPAIDPSNPDYIPLSVTNSILGGSFGSRITSNIREQKGYTYSPVSVLSTRYRDGYWAEIADVTTAVTGPSIKEIFAEVERMRKEPPPEDELKGIKDYMAGLFVLQNSSRQGIIGQLVFGDLHGLGDQYLDHYVQNVYALTPQQVQQTAQKYLDSSKMTIVVVGDKSKVSDQLAPYQNPGQ